MSIEMRFDISFIAAMALREKQIQQNYRPIIAVHKWFARRPGTLFRGLALAEFGSKPLREIFFRANDFPGKRVCDPFMGGGTPLLEANRVGCDVLGFDINPMAAWIVREEIEHLDLGAYRSAADTMLATLAEEIGGLYRTRCPHYGDRDVPIKYALWVKTIDCDRCGRNIDLFPGYLIADNTRHPLNVLVCHECGELNEVADMSQTGKCRSCQSKLIVEGPAKRNRCACRHCGHVNRYPHGRGPMRHRLFAIEYYNPYRKAGHIGRFFKKPDVQDLASVAEAEQRWRRTTPRFVPNVKILAGDETDRLHRWGYIEYRELFNDRQLLGLERSCQLITGISDQRVRHALATNLSDLLRYQNMLCRYDTMALKSLDIFSIHGFPVGLVQCESNLLGITNGSGMNRGSGGWTNIIEKYARAKRYCDAPFEVRQIGTRKSTVPIKGEWIGEHMPHERSRDVVIHCASSTTAVIPSASLDAVFTDPPYFGNVQYGELMDFCYAWLRQLVGEEAEGFDRISTRSPAELTGNITEERGLVEFASGLSAAYLNAARALKPGAPFVFTFHHNKLEAYQTIGVAVLDAGLTCTQALPCPAEMSGSIHIHGTGSSIVDTVFVCRDLAEHQNAIRLDHLEALIMVELGKLEAAGMRLTQGDIRCITYGHLTRLAVLTLYPEWDNEAAMPAKLSLFGASSRASEIMRSSSSALRPYRRFGRPKPGTPNNREACPMHQPFEAEFADIESNIEIYIDAVFASLRSEFLTLPKGRGFIEYPTFEAGYEALKRVTGGFQQLEPEAVFTVVCAIPVAFIVLRTMLGFTPPEWAYITTEHASVEVPQGAARTLDRNIRLNPGRPLPAAGGVTEQRVRAMIATACKLLTEGPPETPGLLHRLDKADTRYGLRSVQPLADLGVPYAMVLYERFLGSPFMSHRNSVSELVGDVVEAAVEAVLASGKISFRKTKRAERVNGFDQAPDFIVPSEFNPKVIVEAKLTEDDGTARDKVTRVQHLGALAMKDKLAHEEPNFEVIACIAGRGFKVRREDMKKLLIATRDKVFTLESITQMVEYSRLREFTAG